MGRIWLKTHSRTDSQQPLKSEAGEKAGPLMMADSRTYVFMLPTVHTVGPQQKSANEQADRDVAQNPRLGELGGKKGKEGVVQGQSWMFLSVLVSVFMKLLAG